MNNVIALIDLHNTTDLGLLTKNRPIASTTFLGRYAFIDFTLSNLSNSGIDDIGILIQDHSRSIIKHFGGGKNTYLKNPKTGFQNMFINEKALQNQVFNTDINNILENDWFLYDNNFKYVVICPVNYLMHIDYNEILNEHIASKRQVSMLVSDVTNGDEKCLIGCEKVTVDALGDVQKIENNDGKEEKICVSLQTYIFNCDFLREVLAKSNNISATFNINNLVSYICSYIEKVHAIKFTGYFRRLASLESYYNASMEMLGESNKTLIYNLFPDNWPIYTLTHNSRPVLYGEKADVDNSLIANGCTVNGTVHHSILSRDVTIDEGAIVEDSIIFTNTHVKSGVHLKNVVVDKHCIFAVQKDVHGEEDKPLYIPQGAHI